MDELGDVIKKTIPQIIFLDIDHLTIDVPPTSIANQIRASFPYSAIVLISRLDQHAVTAFEIDAIDFLVKPLTEERFLLSLKKTIRYLKGLQVAQNPDPLPVKVRRGIELIDQEKIAYLTSDLKETKICVVDTEQTTIKTNEPLKQIERRLNTNLFIRTHRSFIVNIRQVRRIEPSGNTYLIYLKTVSDILYLSKSNFPKLYSRLEL
ncbi:LytR/AlgR family response regulator transcription factor [Numidum massiliense]|uniref:LytR/AlgR family response regulator transcription factor n=1 Tax=Numidum massiliense TaxID=1522315 RepID=UPI00164E864A|nr:LytTR family DNA-binding domain-containing protein [Numidum massiliense]